MGSRVNFRNFADGDMNQKQAVIGNVPLARQNSVFSLTFDEFQNTWVGLGKDFGSMNMDELLKNIWTAEESQAMNTTTTTTNNINNGNNSNIGNSNGLAVAMGGGGDGCVGFSGGNLQRQGSFTLPRTLSQKTVDEVWRELMKDSDNGGGGCSNGGSDVPQRQQTLGEITLEEFLVRAGVVREEPQPLERPDNINGGFYGFGGNASLGLHQNNFVSNHTLDFSGNAAGVRLGGLPPRSQPQQETAFPKQATIAFTNNVDMANISKPIIQEVRSTIAGVQDCPVKSNLLQAVNLKTGVTVAAVSPGGQMSPDLTPRDASVSPVPYMFGRGRRSGAALEKVIERRQRRMIKNRESAARSRARKQAYTMELEAEVAKLKELNNELQKKQAVIMEVQKNQLLEPIRQPWGCKRQCLRRTLTGPW
ncbi:PREDICTED: ABSCISIC ACID-INSENSITIVE 5-like protein 6 [Tarenaya hassleriana]|uniref:ABSCISIC ACID-INSENSITIVE 5-like protein 6 n=1 Tax=Tarenaya hassleriana TaxID=28532 RepID=UPI00053C8401|nr:PREDICTED: ABSCISIC ACID-INSENSITIVE 5-like protein 6 [Tarenaya hassleriana]XP_010548014.1 PREDICTED: ABSCISIC ACID-INSENSITIVE 5-like protein 6 [Tarenaya hassleriana]XP_010548015.1 PREDICTED: ABSCISIC ACID-INSENSITIVE 5-like protein 6 [Tarenaya hassleriana]XP_010548017.1 PREDICTED: ABSCISIC ACID-INSENSITIVE 5-like protein 6 [Tarenaya hassleriana]